MNSKSSKFDPSWHFILGSYLKKYFKKTRIYVYIYIYIYIYIYLSTLCHSLQRLLKTFPGAGYLHSEDGHSLVNLDMAHHFILLWFNPLDLRFDKEGGWFEHSVS